MDENEYLDLPDDPEEAFAVFHAREYERMERDGNGNGWEAERRYVNKIIAFDEVYGLSLLEQFRTPPRGEGFAEFFHDFWQHADIASEKIRMEAARRQKTGAEPIVVLDATARTALHHFIGQIREKLWSAPLLLDRVRLRF